MPKKDVHRGGACYWQFGQGAKQPYRCGDPQSRRRAETRINRQIAAIYASGYKK